MSITCCQTLASESETIHDFERSWHHVGQHWKQAACDYSVADGLFSFSRRRFLAHHWQKIRPCKTGARTVNLGNSQGIGGRRESVLPNRSGDCDRKYRPTANGSL